MPKTSLESRGIAWILPYCKLPRASASWETKLVAGNRPLQGVAGSSRVWAVVVVVVVQLTFPQIQTQRLLPYLAHDLSVS